MPIETISNQERRIEEKRRKNDLYIAVCLGAIVGSGITTVAMLVWVLV